MEFHHKDPRDKRATVSELIKKGASIERVAAEIRKCATLCANCHKILHWEETH